MASWTYQKPNIFSGRNSVGMAISIAAHVVAIVLALTLKAPSNENQPAPIAVRTLISDAPQQQTLEPVEKPRFDRPPLTIAQPDIAIAEPLPISAPVATSVARNEAPATAPVSQPVFDADYLNNPAPQYPHQARRLREEGVVLVRVYVLSNGLPERIELKRSSGSHHLDNSALETVRKWRFVPARRGNETVAAWVVVPVAFSLTA